MKKLVQGSITAAQDLNAVPLSRESEALPLGHCTLGNTFFAICDYWLQFAIYFILDGKCCFYQEVILWKTCRLVTLHLRWV